MKIILPTAVDLRTVPGDVRLFELTLPFIGVIGSSAFTIQTGFVTDFASVPKLFQNVITNDDPDILRPSIVHDWLYQHGGAPPGTAFAFTRAQADAILREAMAACGASWHRRWTVWAAVRLGGTRAWRTATLRRCVLHAERRMAARRSS